MKRFKSSLMIGMSLALLWVLLAIKITGKYLYEPNNLILAVEIGMLALILGFGVWAYLRDR